MEEAQVRVLARDVVTIRDAVRDHYATMGIAFSPEATATLTLAACVRDLTYAMELLAEKVDER